MRVLTASVTLRCGSTARTAPGGGGDAPLAELDAGLDGERDAALRLDVAHRAVGGGDDPLVIREIFQAPDVWVRRVARDDGGGAGEIVEAVVVRVMRKELRVVVEHHDLAADAYGGGQGGGAGGGAEGAR